MTPLIRSLAVGLALGLSCAGAALAQADAAPSASTAAKKILRIGFRSAETSFDPAKINDLYSRTVTPHIFEALYQYDHLARPIKVKPLIAEGMPTHSDDYREWTVKVRPGIYFASDPAFKGVRREVTAQDFVYPYQRIADPANKSPLWGGLESTGYVGLAEARKAALDGKKPFDYDARIEGIQALDRYTIRFRLKEPRPRFAEGLAGSDLLGAQAREVVEFYGDKIDAHPVGTGPFRLKQWRRSSLVVLERNPEYREVLYDAEPAADDAEGQAILAKFKGRRLPMVDEVHVTIIQESQPRWLTFLNGDIDILGTTASPLPSEFVPQALPNGKLAPNLAKRGIRFSRRVNSDVTLLYFNMDDPVVGGYTPEKIALRRAISLAQDIEAQIGIYRNQAIPAQSPVVPHTSGYDPAFKSEMSEYSPARAKALLDMYGYVDRDGDGWRDLPDGKPLVLEYATSPDQIYREFDTVWKKNLDAIRVRTEIKTSQWAENLKKARAGKLQVWTLGSSAAGSDGQGSFARLHGPQSGGQNLARFRLPAFDAIYERMQVLPDGPERLELFRQGKLLATAYMPYRNLVHRIQADLWHPWLVGYRRPVFWNEWWHLVDIDTTVRPASRR
ncbi:MAG TPA: ABC transporter substrate-binding protein [Burkholderiaceae bacterium]|nr:ABC transporter substrate-binding protein [Burkholderiaceae bacterium]